MTSHSPNDSDDVLDVTQGYSRDSTNGDEISEQSLPIRLGRYTVRGRLGRGGFADVLLAHDEQLDRQIALKLPRRDRFQDESQLRAFVEEARTAARLQHPGIVAVFDVGVDGATPFIVLEYIRGRSLTHLLEHESLSSLAAAQLIAEIAEALAHAHEQGFVHRDIKPQNILLDTDDRPHIADFGLAVRHREQAAVSEDVAGTTHYMSPEQVRSENHRIDGRTDLWALGVVFYRILTGRLPFTGSSAQEVFQKILYTEPTAPRQIDSTIPSELERICLRCLCQQMSGRYRTAADLSDELTDWIRFTTGGSGSSLRRRGGHIEPPDAPVIPRGLRSFTQEDRDFFLRLVPGPRDREGLPTPIRFWKHCIEEREPDETFKVGLLYGPSGCGKSSLIKAGVLPRLNSDISTLYVDATSHDTEARILHLLRRKFKGLARDLDLADSLRELREQAELRSGHKVVIVMDQFEQWLHQWQTGADAELVRALLQCDGGNVQCVLMVRDDFWLPVSRFMRQLELGIVDGTNAMLVDSFDPDHAQRVLRELGIAYKRLPSNPAEQTFAQAAFISQATEDLAENNRLYPVRLAVFVEMVKDREWTLATLDEMGGTQGVGVAFLENSVGSRARAARRVHEQAARGVLAALLPQAGQIKDSARTRTELLEASNYGSRPKDFDELMHLLDVELRLLTPARSADDDTRNAITDSTSTHTSVSEPVYQLTHDFLVPSIREWLECQLRETRSGRARLLLQEQAELWNSRPSKRSLPSLLEWIWLRALTHQREWTRPQRRMMQAARSRLLRQTGLVCLVLLIGSLSSAIIVRKADRRRKANEAAVLVSKLNDVNIDDVPSVVAEMTAYREWVDPLLAGITADSSRSERTRIRAAIASLPATNEQVAWLTDELTVVTLSPRDFHVIRNALAGRPDEVADQLRRKLADEQLPSPARFRVACALAAFDDSEDTWSAVRDEVAASLLREPAAFSMVWIDALQPISNQLRDSVLAELAKAETLESARIGVLFLSELDVAGPNSLVEGLAVAKGPQYRAIVERLRTDPKTSLPLVRSKLAELCAQEPDASQLDEFYERQANLVVASLELGDGSLLSDASKLAADPRLRTYVVQAMRPERVDLTTLLPLILEEDDDVSLRNVAMRAAWHQTDPPMSSAMHDRLIQRLLQIYRGGSDAESHSVSGLLLRKLGRDVASDDRELAQQAMGTSRDWFVDKAGQSMIVLRPTRLHIDGYTVPSELTYSFAISATEVQLDRFCEFDPQHMQDETFQVGDQNIPVTGVLIYRAAMYCNWLNRKEEIPEQQWCYPPDSEMTVKNCYPVSGFETKTGYRLPLTSEWEFACRAGSTTSRFFGENVRLMNDYGWHVKTSNALINPVAQLLPNAFGLFDMYGNVSEDCIDNVTAKRHVTRGGDCYQVANLMDSSTSIAKSPQTFDRRHGFRVVRRIDD
jgi:serine/threonine protein kinase/formylglycine-generating enzyme required for sulfatase activity